MLDCADDLGWCLFYYSGAASAAGACVPVPVCVLMRLCACVCVRACVVRARACVCLPARCRWLGSVTWVHESEGAALGMKVAATPPFTLTLTLTLRPRLQPSPSPSGLSYSGAVLGTRDGSYPTSPAALERMEAALGSAGILPWELSFVVRGQGGGAVTEWGEGGRAALRSSSAHVSSREWGAFQPWWHKWCTQQCGVGRATPVCAPSPTLCPP